MSKKSKNDQVPTPEVYVENMLDRIGYRDNITGQAVLENSCGQGNILVAVVRRYIADARNHEWTNAEIREGLERDIIAFEKDKKELDICIRRLNELCTAEEIENIAWNINNGDFLKSDFAALNVQYVIGNPPYITYHDMEEADRAYLKDNFEVCRKGRFDYCYAFIEASINSLREHGKMIYLIPFSIFRNRYAADLRRFIRNDIVGVTDFSGKKVFPGVTCSAAFLCYEKGSAVAEMEYENCGTGERRRLLKENFGTNGEKWVFHSADSEGTVFGDFFKVSNSVATLLNEAFLIWPEGECAEYFYVGNERIEKAICLPAISTKSEKRYEKQADEIRAFIIFPYKRTPEGIGRFSEEEFEQKYPHAYQHMMLFREKLGERKADEKVSWFEYGRGQVLNELWQQKLVLPMVITQKTRVYAADSDAVPYAGYFVTRKADSSYTLEDAAGILQSEEFYRYVQNVGTPTTETSYRVSVNDIKAFRFG